MRYKKKGLVAEFTEGYGECSYDRKEEAEPLRLQREKREKASKSNGI